MRSLEFLRETLVLHATNDIPMVCDLSPLKTTVAISSTGGEMGIKFLGIKLVKAVCNAFHI